MKKWLELQVDTLRFQSLPVFKDKANPQDPKVENRCRQNKQKPAMPRAGPFLLSVSL